MYWVGWLVLIIKYVCVKLNNKFSWLVFIIIVLMCRFFLLFNSVIVNGMLLLFFVI